MCVKNPVPFHTNVPITAYKVMLCCENIVVSAMERSRYKVGDRYSAEVPNHWVSKSSAYDVGFHAYEKQEDAKSLLISGIVYESTALRMVEVELTGITHKGTEQNVITGKEMNVYVAQQCRFIKVME